MDPYISGAFYTRNRVPISPEIETLFGHTSLIMMLENTKLMLENMQKGDKDKYAEMSDNI